MTKNDKHCKRCDSSNTIVLEGKCRKGCSSDCDSSSTSDISCLDSCSSSSSSSYRYESNFKYLAKDKKCNSSCSSSSSSSCSSSSSDGCDVCTKNRKSSCSSSSAHSLTSSFEDCDYKSPKHNKKHDKRHDKKRNNKNHRDNRKHSVVRKDFHDFDFKNENKKDYIRKKEFNISFRKFNQHRYSKHIKNNGQAIYIENYMCPNLYLNVGDKLIFNVEQKGNKENNFVLTESPISHVYGNVVLPIPGFTPVKEGRVEYTVTKNTPKVFHYCSSISSAFGGNIKIRN